MRRRGASRPYWRIWADSIAAKYILAVLAAVFLLAAAVRYVRDNRRVGPASRTWLLIAIIFSLVSLWLWFGGHG